MKLLQKFFKEVSQFFFKMAYNIFYHDLAETLKDISVVEKLHKQIFLNLLLQNRGNF